MAENRLYWGKDGGNTYSRLKKFLAEMDGAVPANLWSYKEVGSTDAATKEVSSILDGKYFDFPKPTALIDKILDIVADGTHLLPISFPDLAQPRIPSSIKTCSTRD